MEADMKKHIISMAMLAALLLLGSCTADAKKKPEAPVRESFGANVEGMAGSPSLTVAIQEFSTDEEVQQLAQSFARGGEDSLLSALGKSNKGYFRLQSSETTRLRIIQAHPTAAGRRLLLVGEAPRAFSPGGTAQNAGPAPRMVMVGHGGYNYTAIQLDVDQQGNGKGLMYISCKVGFNEQGQLVITPMTASSPLSVVAAAHQLYQLVNVHREK
jgi:hypothetical protein